jgi:hypothetical protein
MHAISHFLYFAHTYCETRPESRSNPFVRQLFADTRFRDNKPDKPFARQRLDKHRLKAGIAEPDTELSIC